MGGTPSGTSSSRGQAESREVSLRGVTGEPSTRSASRPVCHKCEPEEGTRTARQRLIPRLNVTYISHFAECKPITVRDRRIAKRSCGGNHLRLPSPPDP